MIMPFCFINYSCVARALLKDPYILLILIMESILTAEAQVYAHASHCGICGGQSVTGTGFSPSPSVFPSHHHSTDAPYILMYHLGDGQRARQRPSSTGTLSHPIATILKELITMVVGKTCRKSRSSSLLYSFVAC
jgi:hypothetical protein